MKKLILTAVIITFSVAFSTSYAQKVWRVNNVDAMPKDFNSLQSAISAADSGDTIYIEGSPVAYGDQSTYYSVILNKQLVLIGPGYYLNGSSANEGLQYNTDEANIQTIRLDSAASGSEFIGLRLHYIAFNNANGLRADNLRFTRCLFDMGITTNYTQPADAVAENWVFDKCFLGIIVLVQDL